MSKLPENVSDSVRKRNPHLYHQHGSNQINHSPPNPQLKPPVRHGQVGQAQGKTRYADRVLVRITSIRCGVLLDIDNLYGGVKFFVDSLRYCGAIPEDCPEAIELQVTQVRCKTRAEARTEITLEPLSEKHTSISDKN